MTDFDTRQRIKVDVGKDAKWRFFPRVNISQSPERLRGLVWLNRNSIRKRTYRDVKGGTEGSAGKWGSVPTITLMGIVKITCKKDAPPGDAKLYGSEIYARSYLLRQAVSDKTTVNKYIQKRSLLCSPFRCKPPIGKIKPFSRITVTFETIPQFVSPSRLRTS